MLEAVVNVSEGRDSSWLHRLAESTEGCVDLHVDADHNRSVLTIIGRQTDLIDSILAIGTSLLETRSLDRHDGVHPRRGLLDVVPFVPLGAATIADAAAARDLAASRLSVELGIPCFLYGPPSPSSPAGYESRTLPEIRRSAFSTLHPDLGPPNPHAIAGASAVGARPYLVAWNIWLSGVSLARTQEIAASLRTPAVRSLGFEVSGGTQVSCNLINPTVVTPAHVADLVAAALDGSGSIIRCELVGLVPASVLHAVDQRRHEELDLDPTKTIESRCAAQGIAIA